MHKPELVSDYSPYRPHELTFKERVIEEVVPHIIRKLGSDRREQIIRPALDNIFGSHVKPRSYPVREETDGSVSRAEVLYRYRVPELAHRINKAVQDQEADVYSQLIHLAVSSGSAPLNSVSLRHQS